MNIVAYQQLPEWRHFPNSYPLVPGAGLTFDGQELAGPTWRLPLGHLPAGLAVSGPRALITTQTEEYHAWGHLGPALLVDLERGTLLATLKGERALALPASQFLLGLEGYAHFDSWLLNSEGQELQNWRSYGHYFLESSGSVRVFECDRQNPTSSAVVRLHRNGAIQRGDRLLEGQIPRPLKLDQDRQLVLNGPFLQSCCESLRLQTLLKLPLTCEPEHSAIWEQGSFIEVGIIQRQKDSYLTHLWRLAR